MIKDPTILCRNPESPLLAELQATPTSLIAPFAFFISYYGVLTLSFNGWPSAVLELKTRLSAAHPALPQEASGSKWPKTSVACLKDGVTLSVAQFNTLNSLCKSLSDKLFSPSTANGLNPLPPFQLALDSAAITIYAARCLERCLFSQLVPFSSFRDGISASPEEKQRVRLIVAEADAPDYYTSVARDGNRASHYTSPVTGVTLVHPLMAVPHTPGSPGGSHAQRVGFQHRGVEEILARKQLLEAVREFRAAVEELLPGLYYWFDETSLHITLRALIL